MTQPPNGPSGDQPPEHHPQHFGQQNQWITGSSRSAGQQEDTQPSARPYQPAQPYDPNQPPAGPPGGGTPYASWQPQQPQPQRRFSDANPLRAAFDFGFNSYATPGLVKIIYVLALIMAALWWLGGGLGALIAGIAARNLGGGGGTVALGVVGLLLGWIPALLWLLFVRIVLEASLALVRVADDARHIRTKIES